MGSETRAAPHPTPAPVSAQASVLAPPLPGCRPSQPLPFSSFGIFLCAVGSPGGAGGLHEEVGITEPVGDGPSMWGGECWRPLPPNHRWVWQESQPGAEGGTRVGEQGSSEQGDKARHPQGDQVRLGEPAGATGTAGQSVAAFHAHAPHPLTQWPLTDSASRPVPRDHESRLPSVAGASLPGSQSAHPEQRCNSSSGRCPRSSACPLP